MSSLYPSLEDFKYDILIHSKHHASNIGTHLRHYGNSSSQSCNGTTSNNKYTSTADQYSIYPPFHNYMAVGSHNHESSNGTQYSMSVSIPGKCSMKAPLSGYTQAHKLQPSNAIKAVMICKDSFGKVGVRLTAIQGGVFVVLVYASSPAAISGIRFGDQILEVNDVPVAGYSMQKVHDLIKKASPDEIRFAIRDRPLERTVTLHKDPSGQVGFAFNKRGKITSIVKDSSAARNGLLIEHNILEINGQNIVGSDEPEIRKTIDNCGDVIVLTIMPSSIFEHMTKQTDEKLLRKNMDHSAPEL